MYKKARGCKVIRTSGQKTTKKSETDGIGD